MSKSQRNAQRLELGLAEVREFAESCGVSEHAVSIRLIAVTRSDLDVQIARLEKTFGKLIKMTTPKQGRGPEWIAYGTIIG